jgi:hypothetical protein
MFMVIETGAILQGDPEDVGSGDTVPLLRFGR